MKTLPFYDIVFRCRSFSIHDSPLGSIENGVESNAAHFYEQASKLLIASEERYIEAHGITPTLSEMTVRASMWYQDDGLEYAKGTQRSIAIDIDRYPIAAEPEAGLFFTDLTIFRSEDLFGLDTSTDNPRVDDYGATLMEVGIGVSLDEKGDEVRVLAAAKSVGTVPAYYDPQNEVIENIFKHRITDVADFGTHSRQNKPVPDSPIRTIFGTDRRKEFVPEVHLVAAHDMLRALGLVHANTKPFPGAPANRAIAAIRPHVQITDLHIAHVYDVGET